MFPSVTKRVANCSEETKMMTASDRCCLLPFRSSESRPDRRCLDDDDDPLVGPVGTHFATRCLLLPARPAGARFCNPTVPSFSPRLGKVSRNPLIAFCSGSPPAPVLPLLGGSIPCCSYPKTGDLALQRCNRVSSQEGPSVLVSIVT